MTDGKTPPPNTAEKPAKPDAVAETRRTRAQKTPQVKQKQPIVTSNQTNHTEIKEASYDEKEPWNAVVSYTVDADIPFWRCISTIKRDIKRLEKDIKRKRSLLNVYFTDVCNKFNITPDDSEEK